MSLVTIIAVAITACITAIITFFFCRQLYLRTLYTREAELTQCKQQLARLTESQSDIGTKLEFTLNEKQSLLIEKKHLETSLEGMQARYSENVEEMREFKNKIAEYEQQFQKARQIEGQAQEQSAQLAQLQTEKLVLSETLTTERNERINAEKMARELNTRLEEQQNHNKKAIQQLNENKDLLKQEFTNLANEILEAKGKVFSDQNKERLESMLKPFKEQLVDFKGKVEVAQKEDNEGRAALKQQLETLYTLNQKITDEAGNLARALKGDKKLQGNWGEIQLEKILESSGLIKGQEYDREANFKDDEGQNKRPDFIVNLPEGKHLIIDSKVSIVDYMEYVNAETDEQKNKALSKHVNCIRNHIKSLSEKGYTKLTSIQAPDFVFMFMPIEPAFIVAFQHDPQLFNSAFEQRIIIVAPTTLLATLRTVANLWSIERQNSTAHRLSNRAGLIYDKFRALLEKMEKLGAQLSTSRETYDAAMSTLQHGQGNLISQANEFKTLGVRVKKELSQQTLDSADLQPEKIEE